jgi:hypothetical protein
MEASPLDEKVSLLISVKFQNFSVQTRSATAHQRNQISRC